MPHIYIIAGPNGAGKTTASYTILPEFLGISQFVNADEIAKGLSPFNPSSVAIQAGKIMLSRIDSLMSEAKNFAFETTLSTRSYVHLITKAQSLGYQITLLFFYLDSVDLAVARVKRRVEEGGHAIPEETVRRRYLKGLLNLKDLYIDLVDSWMVLDNSHNPFTFVAVGNKKAGSFVYNEVLWQKIVK